MQPTAWRGAPRVSVAPVDADCAFLGKIGTVCMSWAAKKETNQEKNQKDSYELRYRSRGKGGEEK